MSRCSCLEAAGVNLRFAKCRSLRNNGVSEDEEGVRGGVLDLRKDQRILACRFQHMWCSCWKPDVTRISDAWWK